MKAVDESGIAVEVDRVEVPEPGVLAAMDAATLRRLLDAIMVEGGVSYKTRVEVWKTSKSSYYRERQAAKTAVT